jgi:hypothetical protein
VHDATSVECALIVKADKPLTRVTSFKWERKEASSMDRSSKKGSKTAGITPDGIKDIKTTL